METGPMASELGRRFVVSTLGGCLLVLAAIGCLIIIVRSDLFDHAVFSKPRRSKATADVRGAELALTKMLADADKASLFHLFTVPESLVKPTVEETIQVQTTACYELLRKGRDAQIGLKPDVRKKLGSSYMELANDPWGHPYQFYFGPLKGNAGTYIFRSYRGNGYVPIKLSPDAPKAYPDIPPDKGLPAAGDQPVYIFSCGHNGQPDQLPWGGNGGDDINSWDNQEGWRSFY